MWVPVTMTWRILLAYEGDGILAAANILNKQSRTAEKGQSSYSLGVGWGAKNPSP